MSMVEFKGHTTVIGTTNSGKTYTVNRLLEKEKQGCLYFNTNMVTLDKGWVRADGDYSYNHILKALKEGKKVNYIPDRTSRDRELIYLIDKTFEIGGFTENRSIYFVVDEVHLYHKEAERKIIEIATSGRTFGFKGVFISQRPAEMNYTVMSQCHTLIFFEVTGFEGEYLTKKGIPYPDIMQNINKNGQHSFCVFDWKNVIPYRAI